VKGVITQAVFLSMSEAGDVKLAKVKEAAGLNCTSCLMSSYHVRFAKESDIVKRH
jgi:hypothetical protein